MKKIIPGLIIAGLIMTAFFNVSAAVHTFTPTPADIYDLDHYRAYTWGVDWGPADGETIEDVVLTFDNIRNWRDEPNNLFIHLFDATPSGLTVIDDGNPVIADYFDGQGLLIDAWSDPVSAGYFGDGIQLSYSFSELGFLDDFVSASADGNFGFGFDPDCHYWNDGVTLTVTTSTPEPATLILLALGLCGGAVVRKLS